MENKVFKELQNIQKQLVAKKDQYNSFGKYPYRNAEGILAEIKPLLKECVVLTDEKIELIGERYYVVATATLTDGTTSISATSQAREDSELKGMSSGQVSGATSSYARKYALCSLFAIDGAEKDLDGCDDRVREEKKPTPKATISKDQMEAKPSVEKLNNTMTTGLSTSELVNIFKNHFEHLSSLIDSNNITNYLCKTLTVETLEIEKLNNAQLVSGIKILDGIANKKGTKFGE